MHSLHERAEGQSLGLRGRVGWETRGCLSSTLHRLRWDAFGGTLAGKPLALPRGGRAARARAALRYGAPRPLALRDPRAAWQFDRRDGIAALNFSAYFRTLRTPYNYYVRVEKYTLPCAAEGPTVAKFFSRGAFTASTA